MYEQKIDYVTTEYKPLIQTPQSSTLSHYWAAVPPKEFPLITSQQLSTDSILPSRVVWGYAIEKHNINHRVDIQNMILQISSSLKTC